LTPWGVLEKSEELGNFEKLAKNQERIRFIWFGLPTIRKTRTMKVLFL
jgi:hypothetical protein